MYSIVLNILSIWFNFWNAEYLTILKLIIFLNIKSFNVLNGVIYYNIHYLFLSVLFFFFYKAMWCVHNISNFVYLIG